MKASTFPAAIEARGVSHRYGTVASLSHVDLGIERGAITALLGPNGAGKTTFVNLVLGRALPSSGSVTTLGAIPGSAAARAKCGVMLQSAALAPQLTVREHVRLFAGYYPAAMPVRDVLGLVGLEQQADRRYGALSGGQQRRVQFALALCGRPQLLVLDEPTVALDAESRRVTWAAIRARADAGAAVLLTTHLLEEAEALADRVVLLAGGRVVADDPPRTIKARVDEQRITCRSALDLGQIRRLPAVLAATSDAGRWVVRTRHAERTLAEWLARDPNLKDLEIARASLEEALDQLLQQEAA
jgi:ABC-2 type transport system ATP-binding protein